MKRLASLLLFVAAAATLTAAETPLFTLTKMADGVYAAITTPKEWLSQQCVATDRSEKHCDEVNERALACERSNAFRQRLGQKVTHESHS